MAYWLSGWGVAALDTATMFCAKARAAGFDKVYAKDYSAEVTPSSRLLFRYARLCSPADWLLRRIGARSQVQSANVLAAHYQYTALKRKLWQYAVITATKPLRNAH